MTFPETSLDELGPPVGHWTAREIAQQPDVWLTIEKQMSGAAGATQAFLEPLLSRKELRIVLTGAGTSACVGECLAPALTRRFGMRVHAIATTDLVAAPDAWLSETAPVLLVSFARSGNSPESVAAIALAEQISSDCHHLIIACNRDGELYRKGTTLPNAYVILLPDETNDRGFAMTSSFSSMLLGAALAFELLAAPTTAALSRWAGQILATFPSFAHLSKKGFERVVYLGSREFKGLAREAALKMLELTDGRIVAVSETPLGFRHGPKTIINTKTLVVMFLCNDPYTRAYELDLLAELINDGIAARVVVLTAGDAAVSASDEVRLADAAGAAELNLCFPFAVFVQSLALQQSLALGLQPDSPNAAGVVNRVVEGVSLNHWDPRR